MNDYCEVHRTRNVLRNACAQYLQRWEGWDGRGGVRDDTDLTREFVSKVAAAAQAALEAQEGVA